MDALADLVRSALDLYDDATPGEPLAKLVTALRGRTLLLVSTSSNGWPAH